MLEIIDLGKEELINMPSLILDNDLKQESFFQYENASSDDGGEEESGSDSQIKKRRRTETVITVNPQEEEIVPSQMKQGHIPPPMPILPKPVSDYDAPRCPLEHINFM